MYKASKQVADILWVIIIIAHRRAINTISFVKGIMLRTSDDN
jgi:hypothetical protein